jgi:hypothetical protein
MNSNTFEPAAHLHRFSSVALDRCPHPDFIDVHAVPLTEGLPLDPAWWAKEAFSPRTMPRWVLALLGVRQLAVRLIGLRPSPADTFAIDDVVGEEALIEVSDRHLDFWCAVGVDAGRRLLRVTTVVSLHGWRGRVYWSVVRLFHGVVVQAMLRRTVRAARPVGS